MILKLALLALCIFLSVGDKILLISDDANIITTHSSMISMLKNSHQLEIAYSFGKNRIKLKNYDRFIYQHVIVMESESQIKVDELISFFDDGGNVIIVGDIDTSKSFRKIFHAFGAEADEFGSQLKDHFSNFNSSVNILSLSTNNYVGSPFIYTNKPLLYRGVGLSLASYENYQLYELVSSEPTCICRNYIQKETTRVGRSALVVGVQGLNNARAILLGSRSFFSDQFVKEKTAGNEEAVQDLFAWTFQKVGIIRAGNFYYHGQGASTKETIFNVGEKIYFQASVEELQNGKWTPYLEKDLQVQFVMLDPWVRIPLTGKSVSQIYKAQFYAPLKEGIYQFKIIYKKPGFTFLTVTERVTLRPYKHDEYERFIFVASPYTFGMIASIVATFVFILVYIYSDFDVKKKQD